MSIRSDNHYLDQNAADVLYFLERLKRRGQALALVCGLTWTFAGMAAFMLAFVMLLGWFGGEGLRAAGWVVLTAGTCLLSAGVFARPFLMLAKRGSVTRRIGQLFPDLASDIISAEQLAREKNAPAFSPELLAGHLQLVLKALKLIPNKDIFPIKPLLWPGLSLFVVISVGIIANVTYSETARTGLASLFKETRPPHLQTKQMSAKAPVIGDLKLTLKYPEYLNRRDRELDGLSGGVFAPAGTTIEVAGASLIENAQSGYINLPNNDIEKLTVNSNGDVYGRFVVTDAGNFSFVLGNENLMLEGPKQNLEIEVDSPPSIRLLRPNGNIEIALNDEVRLDLEAEDDHGIRNIDLVLRSGSKLAIRKTIIQLADRVKSIKTTYHWKPESVRLGDEDTDLRLELEAYDNDTIMGPKPGHSDPIAVKILSLLGRHENAVEDQAEVLDALVDLLAKRLSNAVPGNRDSDLAMNRFTNLSRETEDVLGKIAHLIQALNFDTLSPKRVTDAFTQMRQSLSGQLFYEESLHRDKLGDYKKRVNVDKVTVRLLENTIIRVDDLIIEQQISRVVLAGGSLEQMRQELEGLLERYNQSRKEPARRVLLDAIAKMEESLFLLEKEVLAIRGKVGDTFVNPSGLIRLDLKSSLDKLRSLLAGEDLATAVSLVKGLQADLQGLLAALEGGLTSFRMDRFGEGDRFVAELLDKVLALEADQLQLRRKTTALMRQYQERLVELMKEGIDSLTKRQLAKADLMTSLTEKIEPQNTESNRSRLVRLRILVKDLRLALGQGDLDMADKTAEEIEELGEELLDDEQSLSKQTVLDLKDTAKQMVEEIKGAYPKPNKVLTDKDLKLAGQFAVDQRELLVTARKLKIWSQNQKNALQFLSSRTQGSLSIVATRMADAASFLQNKQVNGAVSEQTAALDELAKLREDLKRGNEAPLVSRPIVLQGRVEIPDPNDYKVPKEFRDEILKAMKDDVPEQYQAGIKKYYETLVQ